MDRLSNSVEYDRIVAAAETEAASDSPAIALSPGHYFEDPSLHHFEEIEVVDLTYESDSDPGLVRLAEEEEQVDSLLQSGGLSPTVYYETTQSASASTISSSNSSETLTTESYTNAPNLSGENKDIFSRIVELVIDGKKAIVHEHLLCEISGFFERLSSQYTSQTPLSLSVRDYSSEITWDTLLVFVKWVYFNELFEVKEIPPNWDELLDLYFIADKWESIVLKNVLLDALIEGFHGAIIYDVFPCHYTKKIWSNTTPGASLRRLWIDFYRSKISRADFREEMKSDAMDTDFLKELSISLISSEEEDFNKEEPPFANDPSIYHVADDVTGICCCRARFEGDQYTHKFQYEHEQARIVSAGWQIYSLEGEINPSEKEVESLQLELRAKRKLLLDNNEEHKKWNSKAKEFEDQLAKLKDSKRDSEEHKDKMIEQLGEFLMTTRKLLDIFNISKDKDALIVGTKVKALGEILQAKSKEVESRKHEMKNAKKRKLDSDWRSGRRE